jgi:hypothetical protein
MTNTETQSPRPIRCGNCSAFQAPVYHASVTAVRECFAARYAPKPTAPKRLTAQEIVAATKVIQAAKIEKATPGIYRMDGAFFRVRVGKVSGQPFAERLTQNGSSWAFTYAPGVVKFLTPEMRVTAAQAAEFGLVSGWCVACAKKIDHPASVAVGYGPVCAKRHGWPHSYSAVPVALSAA